MEPINIIVIEDSEEEAEEAPPFFEVNVFPTNDWVRFPIIQSRIDNREGLIDLTRIHDYARRVFLTVAGGGGEKSDAKILYHINVVHAVAEIVITDDEKKKKKKKKRRRREEDITNVIETRRLADSSYEEYEWFLDIELNDALMTAFNDETKRRAPFTVLLSRDADRKSFKGARVILFPAMRDIARHFYERAPLWPTLLDYEITVYQATEEESIDLGKYIARVNEYNDTLSLFPQLPVVLEMDQFPVLARIIFIARRGREIIGYCGCTILPYRIEVARQFDETMALAMQLSLSSKPVKERYFMGVDPSRANLFEIEGLSASPYESGNNVGLALLYEAMRFIRDTAVQRFYPVSHVVSQAASYITKLHLLKNFHFRYHASNNFMNEGFVEIIRPESKEKLVVALSLLLEYYVTCVGTLKSTKKRVSSQLVTTAANNVIKLYQLYYLILKWERPFSDYSARKDVTLDALIGLFELLANVLSCDDSLSDYFVEAKKRVTAYRDDPMSVLDGIEATIIWDEGMGRRYDKKGKELPAKYGFMLVPEEVKDDDGKPTGRKLKDPYVEGYDVIYAVLPNIIDIIEKLQLGDDVNQFVGKLLGPIEILVHSDLVKDVDYESPINQLDNIRDTLEIIIEAKSMAKLKDMLERTLLATNTKIELVDSNTAFNKAFSKLYVFDGVFDCFLSFELLEKEWSQTTEKNLLAKFAATATTKQQQQQQQQQQKPSGGIAPIPLPKTRELLFEQINVLYEIIVPNLERESLVVSFNGAPHTIATLIDHFNKLSGMENEIEPCELITEMEIEGGGGGVSANYSLEDFIEEDGIRAIDNVLNEARI